MGLPRLWGCERRLATGFPCRAGATAAICKHQAVPGCARLSMPPRTCTGRDAVASLQIIDISVFCAYMGAQMTWDLPLELSRQKIATRLEIEGWALLRHGANHDVFVKEGRPVAIVPRHRVLSIGVARSIAKAADWNER